METQRIDQYIPRVSIIIVNYNGYRWLKMFIPRLVETRYPDFEIVVVDNSSTDESARFLEENYSHIRLVKMSENVGAAKGTNIGVVHSTGEVLAFLNTDVEVTNDWLTNAVSKLTSDGTIAAVQCKVMSYQNRAKIDCIGVSVDRYNFHWAIGLSEVDNGQYDNLDEIGASMAGAMVMWKHIFYEVGCFDDLYFIYYDDIDLSWRIRLAGYKICTAGSSVVYHVGSGTSNSRSSNNRWNPSPFFAYINSRNNIYCWLKNSHPKTIFICWPVFLFANLALGLYLIPSVSPRAGIAYLRGLVWPLKLSSIRRILKERKKIDHLIREQGDSILFVWGIIDESSHLSKIVKKAPLKFKEMLIRNKEELYSERGHANSNAYVKDWVK